MNIFNIPPGVPFARALAAELLRRCEGKPETLPQFRILLPTRRACRVLHETFLQITDGAPLLLPRMQPLGDVDEEELTITATPGERQAIEIVPPAIDPLRRRVLLSRLVQAAQGFSYGPAHALALADALARLIDRIHTEDLSMDDLPALVPEDFAAHWQVTLRFLTVISREWPRLLNSMNAVDGARRRVMLMDALSTHWRAQPPATPVIAARSTGSIPATARLLKTIAALPQGAVILPGLDPHIDDESWKTLDDAHPQATLKHLLGELGLSRDAVKEWPGDNPADASRGQLASEIMRPAATAGQWAKLKNSAPPNLNNILRADLATAQEEARFIAALFRQTLETPGKIAALVTPDRALARRVMAACRRWNIEVDDSAGQSLNDTHVGIFLRLVTHVATGRFAPGCLLSLLRHGLCAINADLDKFEIGALRGPKPPPGIEGLRNRVADSPLKNDKTIAELLDALENIYDPFPATSGPAPFAAILEAHIGAAEQLAGGPDNLWSGDDGEAAAAFLAELRECAADMPDMTVEDYEQALEKLMQPVTVRQRFSAHPRLAILGQLEARMAHADLVIMGGMNEGTWPRDAGHDPWMSRPMMKQFGLPAPERSTGLAAHDFVQGFCAAETVMTRAQRVDGAPGVPSRWLQRLDAVLQGYGMDSSILQQAAGPLREALHTLDENAETKPAPRPAPRPDISRRPRKLSVTQIETWMRDPYSIYAEEVLKLKKHDALEQAPGAADRGNILHKAMERFISACRTSVPDNAQTILLDAARDLVSRRADDPGFWDFWWPRFIRIAGWVTENERGWRETARPEALEAKGRIDIGAPGGTFTLSARADRIDALRAGGYAIIDYKSGGNFTAKAIKSGEAPQLPLEAVILADGGFEGVAAGKTGYLGYWVLSGGEEIGKPVSIEGDLTQTIMEARAGLAALVAAFDDPAVPYYCLPDPDRPLRFNDYEQLARLQEWAALGEDAEAA